MRLMVHGYGSIRQKDMVPLSKGILKNTEISIRINDY